MTLIKIGQKVINLDQATSIQDITAAQETAGRGKAKGKAAEVNRGGGIRVTFDKENTIDFTGEDAENFLRFLDAHVFLPPPGPIEPLE
jgi:hypothetical protein